MAIKIESTTDTEAQIAHTMGNAKMPGKQVDAAQEAKTSSKIVPDTATVGPKSAASKEKEDHDDPEIEEDDVTTTVQAEGSEKQVTGNPEKKKGGFQKKIDKLTKRSSQAEQERDYWKEQALKAGQKAEPEKAVEPVAPPTTTLSREPKESDFKTNAEYVKAMTKYQWDAYEQDKANKANVEKMKSEREKMMNDHNSRVAEYSQKVADFSDVLHEVDDIPFTPALADVLLSHDRGPELMYALAKDPANYERISKLPIRAIEREIGKLEAKLEAPSATQTEKQTEKKTTTAPAPLRPVAAATTPTKKIGWYEGMPLREYREWRKSQGAQ